MTPKVPKDRKPSPSAERGLLLGIWAVLFLVGALWRFWPGASSRLPQAAAPVKLGRELAAWFGDAQVAERLATHYVVRLSLLPTYQRTVREPRLLHLGYGLSGENRVLYRGSAPCLLDGSGSATIDLPNPDGIAARDIELYLAH